MEKGTEGLEKELEALLASQAELVGSLTHDLKGLLSGIDGGIYLADSGFKKDKPERITQGFEMVKRNMGRIRRTVSSVLYYVKDREVSWEQIDIREMTSSVTKVLQEKADHDGVKLHVKVEEGSFEGGEIAVHSLLVNLVEYSLEACRQGGAESSSTEVTLAAALNDQQVVFDIIANGFVIEEEPRKLALGEYYTPRGVDRSHLGLFIAHKLAKSHQGTLSISSSPEKGTTHFSVKLPRVKPADLPTETDDQLEKMFGED